MQNMNCAKCIATACGDLAWNTKSYLTHSHFSDAPVGPRRRSQCTLWCFFQCWRQCIRYCWQLSVSQSVPDAVSSTSRRFFIIVCADVIRGGIACNTFFVLLVRDVGRNVAKMHKNRPLLLLFSSKNTIEHCTAHIIVSQDGRRSIWIVNSCKFKIGMHYERAARSEAAIQKAVAKKFLKSGDGGDARGGRADTEGVCEMCLCNCTDIFIESPPSLSCVLQRALVMLVDGESSRGAVFSIIPEAIVRAASERLTVASWDFTKTQQNIRRKGWNVKIRAGGVKSGETKPWSGELELLMQMWDIIFPVIL